MIFFNLTYQKYFNFFTDQTLHLQCLICMKKLPHDYNSYKQHFKDSHESKEPCDICYKLVSKKHFSTHRNNHFIKNIVPMLYASRKRHPFTLKVTNMPKGITVKEISRHFKKNSEIIYSEMLPTFQTALVYFSSENQLEVSLNSSNGSLLTSEMTGESKIIAVERLLD